MHKSGGYKEKRAPTARRTKKQEATKHIKLDTFFEQKSQLNDEISNSTRLIVPLDSKSLSGSNEPDALVHPQPPNTEVGENQMISTEIDIQLRNDIRLWSDNISEDVRNFWVSKGSKDCRKCDANFLNSAMIHGKEGYRRYCSKYFFTRVHPLTGECIELMWLCYSHSKGKLCCFTCTLLTHSNSAFAQGFNDRKHGDERISLHENSQNHREAMAIMCTRQTSTGRIDNQICLQIENERQYWSKVLERAICVIKFLGERGLAFRGRDEIVGSPSNGNYLGVMEVLVKYDVFLAQHITQCVNRGRGHTSYLSSTICEELISLIGGKVLDTIIQELNSAKFYSLSVDSTPDFTHSDQLTFTVRYVLPTGPEERFLNFLPMIGHTGKEIANMILTFLEENGIDIKNCRGQSYGNASNMSGK